MKISQIQLQVENIEDSLLSIKKENLQGAKGGHYDTSYIEAKTSRIRDYLDEIETELRDVR